MDMDDLVTTREAADAVGYHSAATVRRLVRLGIIDAVEVGRKPVYLVRVEDVEEFKAIRRVGRPPKNE